MVEIGAVMVKGAPEVQLKIPPSCQRSINRDSHPLAFPNSRRFGPNGSSSVALLVNKCVRWKPDRVLFSDRSLGSRYVTAPSVSFSPSVRLHVYAVEFVKPCDRRLVT